MSLLDPSFKYTPAINTDVLETFRKFGFQPTSDEERRARLARFELRTQRSNQTLTSHGDDGVTNSNVLD